MKDKKGLIMGVANERSIAWGISQKLAEAGAELAFTYLGDALKKRVIPLAEKLNSKVTFSCDVEKKEEVTKLFEDIKIKFDFKDSAKGTTLFFKLSPKYVKESSAPFSDNFFAIPQAIERSFATPIINPFLPFNKDIFF